ncbi:hypothetical protein AMELA_G00252710 [Ameiurus melas]|uniref:Uncharacterized protein n=1 Tax=Ameiurus melas TaxID=219545 RepID=A0A7J5ZTB3_AMEME|nr:hypothetical protein AMELA_G00252710 [Ameiurus melas]
MVQITPPGLGLAWRHDVIGRGYSFGACQSVQEFTSGPDGHEEECGAAETASRGRENKGVSGRSRATAVLPTECLQRCPPGRGANRQQPFPRTTFMFRFLSKRDRVGGFLDIFYGPKMQHQLSFMFVSKSTLSFILMKYGVT